MHLFRSILNAHFLRYVTLVVVACFGFLANFHSETNKHSYSFVGNVFATPCLPAFPNCDQNATQTPESTTTPDASSIKDIDTTFIKMLNLVIAAISFLYVPFSMLSGWLLSPDWTFGDFIHLRPVLHSLWIFVSNTVYVVFAAMLIVVAIANIFGQSDSYAIKKMLPRFIIGVIMVPFTWWMVSATLSVSSYMTALVLRMPADMITASNSPQYSVDVPQKCSLDFTTSNTSKVWDCDPPTKKFISEFLKSDNAYGIIPLYAYNIFKFDDLDTFKKALNNTDELSPEQKAEILKADEGSQSMLLQAALIATGLAKVGVQLFMSVLFALVFMIILIALVLVLFTRVIKMWMYAIFSPLFALRYFLDDKVKQESALGAFKFGDFIALAMVPVVVSGALSFGFLFLMTFKTHMEQPISKTADGVSTQKGIDSQFVTVKNETNASSGSIDFFGIEIGIKLPEGSTKSVNGENADNLRVALLNVLSGLITPILGVIILWMAVMAAIKTSVVAGKAVEGIEKLGGEAVGMAKKVPNLIPITSVKAKDGSRIPISIGGLQKIPDILKAQYNKIDDLKTQSMRQAMGFDPAPFEAAAAAVRGAGTDLGENVKALNTNVFTSNRTATDVKSEGMIKTLQEVNTNLKLGVDPKANLDGFLDALYSKLKPMGNIAQDITTSEEFKRKYYLGGDSLASLISAGTKKIKDVRIESGSMKFGVDGAEQAIDVSSLNINKGSSDGTIQKALIDALKAKGVHMEETDLKKTVNDLRKHLPPAPSPGGSTP